MSSTAAQSPDTLLGFPRLAPELRQMIWEWATLDHGLMIVDFDNGEITAAARLPHPLMHTCFHSRSIYLGSLTDVLEVEDKSSTPSKSKKKHVAVNFAWDVFYLRGFTLPCPAPLCPALLCKMQNFIVDSSALNNSFALQDTLWRLDKLQRFWVYLADKPEQFSPVPATLLQRHCSLHHCQVLPETYTPLAMPRRYRDEKEICPACQWQNDIFGDSNVSYHNFKLVFDSALPVRPTRKQIEESNIPAVAWLRVTKNNEDLLSSPSKETDGKVDEFDEKEMEEIEAWERAAQTCLMRGSFNCSHERHHRIF